MTKWIAIISSNWCCAFCAEGDGNAEALTFYTSLVLPFNSCWKIFAVFPRKPGPGETIFCKWRTMLIFSKFYKKNSNLLIINACISNRKWVYISESLDSCFTCQIRCMAKKMMQIKTVSSWTCARSISSGKDKKSVLLWQALGMLRFNLLSNKDLFSHIQDVRATLHFYDYYPNIYTLPTVVLVIKNYFNK